MVEKTKTEEMLTLDNMSKRDLYEIAYRSQRQDTITGHGLREAGTV